MNQDLIKENLDKFKVFLNANHMIINSDKTVITEIMNYQKRNRLPGDPPTLEVVMADNTTKVIEAHNYIRILGINISNDMRWNEHLESGKDALLPSIRKTLCGLCHIARFLPQAVRKTLINGLIVSRLSYMIQIWARCPRSLLLQKAQTTLNEAARFVMGMRRRTRRTILMKAVGWLSVAELAHYHTLITTWRVVNRNIPEILAEEMKLDDDDLIEVREPCLLPSKHSFKQRARSQCPAALTETVEIPTILPYQS